MGKYFIGKVFREADRAAAVGPTAYVYRNADCGRVAGCVFHMHAHYGGIARQTLWADPKPVDPVCKQRLQLCSLCVWVAAPDFTHQGFFGQDCCGIH